MSTNADENIEQPSQDAVEQVQQPEFALIFELETVAVAGRAALFDLLKQVMAKSKIELTRAAFSRNCLSVDAESCIPQLLEDIGSDKLVLEKVVKQGTEGMAAYFSSDDTVLNDGLGKLIDIALAEGLAVFAVSSEPEEVGVALLQKLGLEEKGVTLFSCGARDGAAVSADACMKITKVFPGTSRHCLFLGSSSTACRAAMVANMRCIGVPDAYTVFQDFSGADFVQEPGNDWDMNILREHLAPEAGV